MMIAARSMHASWLPAGVFFIWGMEGKRPLSARQLLLELFAWHAPSFYGTMLEEAVLGGKQGVLLPAGQAISFWAGQCGLRHGKYEWSEPSRAYQKNAELLKRAIAAGSYAPVLASGHDATLAKWGLVWDDALLTMAGAARDAAFLDTWLDHALREWLTLGKESGQVWEELRSAHPLAAHLEEQTTDRMDLAQIGFHEAGQEEWLEALGFWQDQSPFQVALSLAEADSEGGTWRLMPVLLDREDARNRYSCTPEGRLLPDEHVPKAWRGHIEASLQRAGHKWRKLYPPFSWEMDDQAAWSFLEEGSSRLTQHGYQVFLPAWWEELRKQKPRVLARMKDRAAESGLFGAEQLLQFDWKLAIGESELSEADFRKLLKQNQRLVYMNGRWVPLHPTWVKAFKRFLDKSGKREAMPLSEALELYLLGGKEVGGEEPEPLAAPDSAGSLHVEVRLNAHLRKWFRQLEQTSQHAKFAPPEHLAGVLRPYQEEGMSWLLFLRQFGLGACLADDMGLGKTIQFIAYLEYAKQHGMLTGPGLLICPTSVLGNWQKEISRFAPACKVYLHYGHARASGDAFREAAKEADLVITSYALSHIDQETLSSLNWSVIGLDEAQNIKNPYGKQSQAIRKLNGAHCIALTGTPVENRLSELWSIFDFLSPGYLGNLQRFHKDYVTPIEKGADPVQTERLQRLIQPFLLRRIKRDPAIQLDLPDKNEMNVYISLTAEQGTLYENELQNMLTTIEHADPMERRGAILKALTKLKQICDHPALYLKESAEASAMDRTVKRSNKLTRLLEMVQEVRDEREKCLIFTQYLEMGRMLQRVLEEATGEKAQFLHGGLSKEERDRMIARFQDDAAPAEETRNIFILSLKAGGTGLNLTGANHVFHFDRWWNPAVENQATDRAYRIGQTKDVQVHKFVALGTLEERINEMIERKQQLSERVIGAGEGWITELSTDELKELFSLRREWVKDE